MITVQDDATGGHFTLKPGHKHNQTYCMYEQNLLSTHITNENSPISISIFLKTRLLTRNIHRLNRQDDESIVVTVCFTDHLSNGDPNKQTNIHYYYYFFFY